MTEAGASYARTRRLAGVHRFERLIGDLTGDQVEALVASLPALEHMAELESQDHEGWKQ
ncbi:hypothetical protein ABZ383_21170 [Streptomyces sp. NPDC005900]|uniref:hypothetical protein n=1 Tax=Streptomyces sp. NPDC005900 TaxID=3154569 RepID=UPI0033DB44F2